MVEEAVLLLLLFSKDDGAAEVVVVVPPRILEVGREEALLLLLLLLMLLESSERVLSEVFVAPILFQSRLRRLSFVKTATAVATSEHASEMLFPGSSSTSRELTAFLMRNRKIATHP